MVDIWQQNLHKWPNIFVICNIIFEDIKIFTGTFCIHFWGGVSQLWSSQKVLRHLKNQYSSVSAITEHTTEVFCWTVLQNCSTEPKLVMEIYGEFSQPKITYLFLLEKNSPVVFALYSVSFSCPLFDGRWYKQYDHLSVVTWSDL